MTDLKMTKKRRKKVEKLQKRKAQIEKMKNDPDMDWEYWLHPEKEVMEQELIEINNELAKYGIC